MEILPRLTGRALARLWTAHTMEDTANDISFLFRLHIFTCLIKWNKVFCSPSEPKLGLCIRSAY